MRRISIALLAIFLPLAAPAAVRAQERAIPTTPPIQLEPDEIAVWGFVREESTGKPLPGQMMQIDSTGGRTVTDSAGMYVFRHVERIHIHELHVKVLGWTEAERYYSETRIISQDTPWSGTKRIGPDGKRQPNPGFAARLDFSMRPWPIPF